MFNLLPRTFINSTLALLRNASGIFLPHNHETPATPPPSSAGQNLPPVSGIADHVSRRQLVHEPLALRVADLSKRYGRRWALARLSCELEAGKSLLLAERPM